MNSLSGLKKRDYEKDLSLDFWIVQGAWQGTEEVESESEVKVAQSCPTLCDPMDSLWPHVRLFVTPWTV